MNTGQFKLGDKVTLSKISSYNRETQGTIGEIVAVRTSNDYVVFFKDAEPGNGLHTADIGESYALCYSKEHYTRMSSGFDRLELKERKGLYLSSHALILVNKKGNTNLFREVVSNV